MTERVCDRPRCGRKHSSGGLCSTHDWRLKHGKDLDAPIKGFTDEPCAYQQCDKRANTRGCCPTHHALLKRHNLTSSDYLDLVEAQDGKCAICRGFGKKPLDIDHDHRCCNGPHSCGLCIRGLLCRRCNRRMIVVDDTGWINRSDGYIWDYFGTRTMKIRGV